jgi:hypothetical protein
LHEREVAGYLDDRGVIVRISADQDIVPFGNPQSLERRRKARRV